MSGSRMRRVFGAILLIAAPVVTFFSWRAANGPLQTLAWFDAHRSSGDSAAYASAQYHAGHARRAQANRWSLGGYATLGTLGTLVGAALLFPLRRRPKM